MAGYRILGCSGSIEASSIYDGSRAAEKTGFAVSSSKFQVVNRVFFGSFVNRFSFAGFWIEEKFENGWLQEAWQCSFYVHHPSSIIDHRSQSFIHYNCNSKMTTKRSTEESGGSRASKKRAKKRNQKQLLNKDDDNDTHETTVHVEEAIAPKKKMQLPMSDDDDEPMNVIPAMSKKSKKKKKEKKAVVKASEPEEEEIEPPIADQSEDVGEEENDVDPNADEEVVDEVLSQLNPIEILFPERLTGSTDEGDDEEVNPVVLIEHIETKRRARAVFESILAPSGVSIDDFYKHYWEKKPLVITKSKNLAGITEEEAKKVDEEELKQYRSRLDGFLSKKKVEGLIRDHPLRYGKDLNVTNFCKTGHGEKVRVTLDQLPEMAAGQAENEIEYIVAKGNDVWQNFENGCTIRLLCPQKHNDEVHALLSNMEHEFGCMVGSNAYLTPGGADNQGFAPHYDDIEAFILQLEGYKHWRVYVPMKKAETLPRESSRDFTQKDMKDADPVIDVELGPGDILYMPRGWIHQANTVGKHHSLHLTMSAMQNWAWVDFLETIMPEALEAATAKNTSLRNGLPRDFLSYMGTMHETIDINSDDAPEALRQLASKTNNEDEEDQAQALRERRIAKLQEAFKAEAKKKIMRICKEALAMVSTGCDQIAKRFLSDRLPPAFTPQELLLTSDNRAENGGKIWPNTLVRLAKPGIAHLVIEEGKAVLYHCVDNSRVFHETPLSPLEFEIDDAPALEALLTTVEPHWICVEDLIHGDIEDKMEITQSLFDEGILAIFQDAAPDTSVQTG